MRTKILKLIAVLSMVLLAFNGCKKDEGEEPNPQPNVNENVSVRGYEHTSATDTIQMKPNVIYVKNDIQEQFAGINPQEKTISYNATQATKQIKVGDVLYSTGSKEYPNGYALKVVSVKEEAGKQVYTYEQAAINDVFKQYSEQMSFQFDYAQILKEEKQKNNTNLNHNTAGRWPTFDYEKNDRLKTEIDLNKGKIKTSYIFFDKDKNFKTKNDQLIFEVSIKILDFNMPIELDTDLLQLRTNGFFKIESKAALKFGKYNEEQKDALKNWVKGQSEGSSLVKGAQEALNKIPGGKVGKDGKKTYKFPLKKIPLTAISPTNLVIKPYLLPYAVVTFDAKGDFEISLEYKPIILNYYLTFGVDGMHKDVTLMTPPEGAQITAKADLEFNFKLGAGIELGVEFPAFRKIKDGEDDISKLALSFEAYIQGLIKVNANADYYPKGGLFKKDFWLNIHCSGGFYWEPKLEGELYFFNKGKTGFEWKPEEPFQIGNMGFSYTYGYYALLSGHKAKFDFIDSSGNLENTSTKPEVAVAEFKDDEITINGKEFGNTKIVIKDKDRPKRVDLDISVLKATANTPPTKPNLLFPKHKSKAYNNVTLKWNKSIDANKEEVSYKVYMSEIGTPLTMVAENIKDTIYTFQHPFADLNFQWKIVATDGTNETESDVFWFNIASSPKLTLSVNAATLKIGEKVDIPITSGSGAYKITSSNPTVATAVEEKEGIVTISAQAKGSATVTVYDTKSKESKTIGVLVLLGKENTLELSTYKLELNEGEGSNISIIKGSGTYSITTNNARVATASEVKAGLIYVVGKEKGTTTLIVKDKATKQQKTIEVTVTKAHPSLVVTSKTAELMVGGQYRINITSGSGKYSVSSQNSHIATASLSGNAIDIVGKSKGNTTVLLEDKESKETVSIAVKVSSKEDDTRVPEGVIIKDGVLIRWPYDKIPANGHITIPDGITTIGYAAFANKRENVNNIQYANDNDKLISVKIPNSVKSINDFAFYNCTKLKIINIPNSVTSIGGGAFERCKSLTSITIPNSVTNIEKEAFYGCSSLSSITIPNSVTSIGGHAFAGCSLTSITIPNSVTSIGDSAFAGCLLTSITIPNSVTSIGKSTFAGCSKLSSITIPNSVTSIGDYAFIGCALLTSITIPNSVKTIGGHAFEKCRALTNITIPNSVTSIGNWAFEECESLKNIFIPNSVKTIGDGAFEKCKSLTSITIPNSVTSIGDSAFAGCSKLSSITIPNSVTSIGDSAFSWCSSLSSITIPNSVTSIGCKTFMYCSSLSTVTIPNSVINIGQLFLGECRFLRELNCKVNTPPKIKNCSIFDVPGYGYKGKLIVPKGTKHLYEKAEGWKDCSPIVEED